MKFRNTSPPLAYGDFPWVFAGALATTLPHAGHQPLWVTAMAASLFLWAFLRWQKQAALPVRWLLVALVVAVCGAVLLQYRTLFGRDAGVALLLLFSALKLLELKTRRDAVAAVTLGYFLLLTHYFDAQGIPTAIGLLVAATLLTATLIRIHGGPLLKPLPTLRFAAVLMVQAVPFMLVLYLLFPRISGPLWGLPQDAHAGRSGLSDQMAPGSIANLAMSGEIAFRVRFPGRPPERNRLYWRGPVLDSYDGKNWRALPPMGGAPQLTFRSPALAYESTVEPHGRRWLLALDAPGALPSNFGLSSTLTATIREPLIQRQRFSLSAHLEYAFNVEEDQRVRERNLQLPARTNPQARALAESWRQALPDPAQRIDKALALFANGGFAYTLTPPLLGEQPMDDFLFGTKRGFCEHFASAFVFLMRASGIPARVVTGYQGGELNPVDKFLVVRQSDAHAWAEVWLAEKGWVRVDPTAVVSPERIGEGITAALPEGEPLPAAIQLRSDWLRDARFRWEAMNNAWNQYVLGYNTERQRDLLSRMGLPDADWRNLAALLAAACATLFILVAAWAVLQRPRRDPVQRLWDIALHRLRRSGVNSAPWETPDHLLNRVEAELPQWAPAFTEVVSAYLDARYGPGPADLNRLRAAVARLPRWRTL